MGKKLVWSIILLALLITPAGAWSARAHEMVLAAAVDHLPFNVSVAVDPDRDKGSDGTEGGRHYFNNNKDVKVTPQTVLEQRQDSLQPGKEGALYGALMAAFEKLEKDLAAGQATPRDYGYLAHYVGDLTCPLHNSPYNVFNKSMHSRVDQAMSLGTPVDVVRARMRRIQFRSEADIAKAVSELANISHELARDLESGRRALREDEALTQLAYSASLYRGILDYLHANGGPARMDVATTSGTSAPTTGVATGSATAGAQSPAPASPGTSSPAGR